MSFTLSNLLQETYKRLGQYNESTATGGTSVTVVDSKLVGEGSDDDWNGGTVVIVYDGGGSGASPEGRFGRVSNYVDSTGTFTIDTVTDAVASGDRYAYMSEFYPLNTMIGLANTALKYLGLIPLVDTTTLDSASSQTEYACQAVWKYGGGPYRVDLQQITTDANDNRWREMPRNMWEYIPATAGSTGLIVTREQWPSGRGIRVWYMDNHPTLVTYDDVILEHINPELAIIALVEKALEWQLSRLQGADEFLMQRLNDARTQLEQAKVVFPIWRPKRKKRLMIIGSEDTDEDKFTYPGRA